MERIVPVVTSVDQELCVWEHGAAVPTGTESEGEMNLESNLEPAAFFFFLMIYLRGEGAFPVVFTSENSIRPERKHIFPWNMDAQHLKLPNCVAEKHKLRVKQI